MIFDVIANEYGYTFDEIRNMTMREIDVAMKYIGIRKHNEVATNARIHGLEMEMKEVPKAEKEIKLSPEKEKQFNNIIDNGMKAIQERKRKRAR